MRTLITGATGFIGAYLARVLVREGCKVFALVRPGSDLWRIQDILPALQVVPCDLLGPQEAWEATLSNIRPDICFHLAWYTQPGIFLTSDLNVQYLTASLTLISRVANLGCKRFVVAGTFSEYDLDLGYLSENSATRPANIYGASKLALYSVLSQLALTASFELYWPRLFYVYGPGEHQQRMVPSVINALLRNEATRLTPGEQIRDFIHVEDAAEAMWTVIQHGLTGAVNVGTGAPVMIREVALRLGHILERPELVRLGDLPYRPGDSMFVCADTRRLRENTRWAPRFTLEDGLRQTAQWWQAHMPA